MKQNLRKNIVKTAMTAVISQVCNVLTALLLPRLIIQSLGSDYNGLIATARQFANYLGMIDTGLYAATCYHFIRAFEKNDTEQVQDLFVTVGNFYRRVSVFAVAIVAVISVGYGSVVASGVPAAVSAYVIAAYSLGTIIAYYGFFKYNIMLFASGKQYYITLACAAAAVATLAGQYFLLERGAPVILIASLHPLFIVLRLLILKRKALQDHPYLHQRRGTVRPELIEQKWDALIMNISDSMKTFAPIISFSLLWGTAYVSVYSVYESVLHLGSSILVMCMNGLTPSLGRELNAITQSSCNQFRRMNQIIMAISGMICSCFAVMIMSFIGIYVGDIGDMSYEYPVMAYLLIVSTWFLMIRGGYELLIKSMGYIKELRKGAVHEILIAMTGCLGAGLFLGMEYVALGVAVSSAYRTIRMMYFCKKRIYSRCDTGIAADFLFWGVITFLVSAAGKLLVPYTRGLGMFLLWAMITGVSCAAVYALAYFVRKNRRKC